MAITPADFNKIWASTSPLTPYSFSTSQYKEGWNFVGATPPSRQMWDFIQKNNDEKMQYLLNNLVPTGCVQAFSGRTTPQGWLLCDGSAVSRTAYAALYAVIGTTYGNGNGSTTFNLPNLVDKFVEGSATSGTVKSAGLPNITGSFHNDVYGYGKPAVRGASGAFYGGDHGNMTKKVNYSEKDATQDDFKCLFDASRSSSIYGKSTTVQPPALTMRYIIKY